jgi:hypothetical protein
MLKGCVFFSFGLIPDEALWDFILKKKKKKQTGYHLM